MFRFRVDSSISFLGNQTQHFQVTLKHSKDIDLDFEGNQLQVVEYVLKILDEKTCLDFQAISMQARYYVAVKFFHRIGKEGISFSNSKFSYN